MLVSTTLFHLRQTRKGAQCSKYWNCPLSLTMPPPAPLTLPLPHSSRLSQAISCHLSLPLSIPPSLHPASFKTARIKPLLKKPTLDTPDIQNYRPVSLHSFLSKTLDRAIANQLSSYLSYDNLLDPHQSSRMYTPLRRLFSR